MKLQSLRDDEGERNGSSFGDEDLSATWLCRSDGYGQVCPDSFRPEQARDVLESIWLAERQMLIE